MKLLGNQLRRTNVERYHKTIQNKLQANADLYGDLDEAYIRIGAEIMFKGKSFTTSKWRAKQLYRLSKAYGELGGVKIDVYTSEKITTNQH